MKKISIFFVVLFITLSKQVGAQEITIFQGFWGFQYYEDDDKITKKEFSQWLSGNKASAKDWKASKNLNTGAYLMLGVEIGFAGWLLSDPLERNDAAVIGLLGSVVGATILSLSANNRRKNAILKYNKSFDKKDMGFFTPSKSGVGLVYQF